jgi:hypothetical protein
MKKPFLILTVCAGAALLGLTACSKKEAAVDTSKVESSFQSAPAADRTDVDKAIAAIKSNDYATALTSLKQAAANVKLTPAQQEAVKDLVAQVQAKLTAMGNEALEKTKDTANKTASDLQKSLPK